LLHRHPNDGELSATVARRLAAIGGCP
jgi:hypothetical protein